jgi:hypothetical protein
MATIDKNALVAGTDPRPLISWGAVFAGLVFVVAATWLLFLLGSAIGVSIADASDAEAVGKGLGIAATIWVLMTTFVAFFIGSLLTARLSGKSEQAIGMLHGITLWSVGTGLMLVLGAWGVRGLIQTGASAVTTVVSAGTSIGPAGIENAQAGPEELADSPLVTAIQARMKREIAEAVAEAQRLDSAQTAVTGQPAPTGRPDQSAAAGRRPAASQQEIRRALDEIDAEMLIAAAQPIVAGDPERAKDVLAVNTSLGEREIDAIVDGVSREMGQEIEKAQQQLNQTVEAASTYTQAVSWITFVAGALGLIVAIAGGWLGAGTVHRLYAMDVSSHTTVRRSD